jgi:hypothetical protein
VKLCICLATDPALPHVVFEFLALCCALLNIRS